MNRSSSSHLPRLFSLAFAALLSAALPLHSQSSVDDEAAIRGHLQNHCVRCHSGENPKSGLDLATMPPRERRALWRSIRDNVASGAMPPASVEKRPTADETNSFIASLDRILTQADASVPVDPGRVTVRRLSRVEYENTVRDLLGVTTSATTQFPNDDLAYGFDNIGDAMTFSMLHLEKYAAAAEDIARQAISIEDPSNPAVRRFEAEEMTPSENGVGMTGDHANMFSRASVSQRIELPRKGLYRLRVNAWGDQAGDELPKMSVRDERSELALFEVPSVRGKPKVFEIERPLDGGSRDLSISFVNDYWNPKAEDPKQRDRNLHVDWLEVTGPIDPVAPTAAETRIMSLDPQKGDVEKRLRAVIEPLASRAWRRPATGSEVKRFVAFAKMRITEGQPFAAGIRAALEAILLSPHFLFRIEPSDEGISAGKLQELSTWALASRLSYFLWSSMPDDRLFDLAKSRKLRDPEVMLGEVRRMLDDDRSRALAENFAVQWLELRALGDITLDAERYPGLDDDLKRSMRRSVELFFEEILRFRRPVMDLLDADFLYLDERLAKHLGRDDVAGDEFRRVALTDVRTSILRMPAILVVTSNPTRTSPVKRGKWILENVLGQPPAAPPPGVDSFKDSSSVVDSLSLREAMALHRTDPTCASCHVRMDALGLALENFDPMGRFRTEDGGRPIDATSMLPDGRAIDGVAALETLLRGDDALVRCLSHKLAVQAIGRELNDSDLAAIDRFLADLEPGKTTIESLIFGIVGMDAFTKRRPGK